MRDEISWSPDPPPWGDDQGWDAPPYGPPSRPRVPPDQSAYPPQYPAYPQDPDDAGPNYPPAQGSGYPPQRPNYPPSGPSYPPQGSSYPPQRPDYPPTNAPGYDDGRYGPPQRPDPPPQWASPTPSRPRPGDNGGYGPPSRQMTGNGGYAQDRAYPTSSRYNEPPSRWDRPAVHDIDTEQVARVRPAHERAAPASHAHKRGWSLPIEHIVLAAGVLAMYLAISQPWGVDTAGHRIFLSATARQAALVATLGLTGLGGLLILLNKRMGCFTLIGCLGLFALPLLVAATVGGFTVLTQLHVVPQIALSNIHANNRGFFLWWGGMVVTIAGLLLQFITHRRKGLIGI